MFGASLEEAIAAGRVTAAFADPIVRAAHVWAGRSRRDHLADDTYAVLVDTSTAVVVTPVQGRAVKDVVFRTFF